MILLLILKRILKMPKPQGEQIILMRMTYEYTNKARIGLFLLNNVTKGTYKAVRLIHVPFFKPDLSVYPVDCFPNWRNSVHVATLQIIGHVLLSTNFNTLQSYLQNLYCGYSTVLITRTLRLKSKQRWGNILIF